LDDPLQCLHFFVWLENLLKVFSELQISCVFAFFTLWKRVKMHVLSDQSVHITHAYCCVSKLSKFGAYNKKLPGLNHAGDLKNWLPFRLNYLKVVLYIFPEFSIVQFYTCTWKLWYFVIQYPFQYWEYDHSFNSRSGIKHITICKSVVENKLETHLIIHVQFMFNQV
jgi:hypothetical protein